MYVQNNNDKGDKRSSGYSLQVLLTRGIEIFSQYIYMYVLIEIRYAVYGG